MPFIPFELERWQSAWEHRVRHNLSESGVHPLSVGELLRLSGESPDHLAEVRLGYNQGNGSDELRGAIAALYPGASPDQVLVTVGSAEANFVVCWALVERGDRAAIVAPTYMQTWGLAENMGARVTPIPLDPARGWEPDLDAIRRAITPGTKLVVVTNPNNPSGHVLSAAAREAILRHTAAAGAWLLADEVYQGAERNGTTTPSFWGAYDRLLVTNGLSKAYGLPGLRIGWVVGPHDMIEALWRRHDYTVIGPSPVSDFLAIRALRMRERILQRTRAILNANFPRLESWLRGFGGLFDWHAPDAGAICFTRYHHRVPGLELVEHIRSRYSILLVPGEHFNMPGYLRIGFGNDSADLGEALDELVTPFREMMAD
jgi:aspartate/methionine/tyrosine aminotransferase